MKAYDCWQNVRVHLVVVDALAIDAVPVQRHMVTMAMAHIPLCTCAISGGMARILKALTRYCRSLRAFCAGIVCGIDDGASIECMRLMSDGTKRMRLVGDVFVRSCCDCADNLATMTMVQTNTCTRTISDGMSRGHLIVCVRTFLPWLACRRNYYDVWRNAAK